MKKILSLSLVLVALVIVLASCQKTYDCVCTLKTVVGSDTVKTTNEHYTIKATKDDAEDECKFHETYEDYLKRPAVNYHYCEIKED